MHPFAQFQLVDVAGDSGGSVLMRACELADSVECRHTKGATRRSSLLSANGTDY